jgi:hypothetical protein
MELFRLIRLLAGEEFSKRGVMEKLCQTVRYLGSGIGPTRLVGGYPSP